MQRVLRSWKWVIVIALVFGLAFQGTRGLWEPDEGRYTSVALEMLGSGDFLTPYRHHHHIHPTKPPMTYWAIAGSLAVFGHHEWAIRLPYALAFVVTVLLVFLIGRRLTPELPGLPALVYASMLLPFLATNVVTTDVFLAMFVTAGAAALIATDGSRQGVRLMWLAFGLAFLTKGPPALLPLAGLVLAYRWSGRPLRAFFDPLGLLVFLFVGLSWYVLVVWRNPGLLSYLFHDELIARSFSAQHGRMPQWWGGLYVYALTLIVGTFPHGWHLLRRWQSSPLTGQGRRNLSAEDKWLWGWLLVPLAVFVCARSRLPLYLLPLFPALALLIARGWLAEPGRLNRRLVWIPVMLVVLMAIKVWAALLPSHKDMRSLADDISARVPFAPQELVFVDMPPKYGLAFYFGVEAEWLDLGSNRDNVFDDSLANELIEEEGPRLYLVPPERAEAFTSRARELGEDLEPFGEVHDYQLFGLRRKSDHLRN